MADFIGLSCTISIEAWILRQLGLKIEVDAMKADMTPKEEEAWLASYQPYRGLVQSAHLPFLAGEFRVNIAAMDDRWRYRSLNILKETMAKASMLGAKKVVMHNAPRFWDGKPVGNYTKLIDSIKELAVEARNYDMTLCLENNNVYYPGLSPDTPAESMERSTVDSYFGDNPTEWAQVARDVNMPNVRLCLDTSHAVTSSHRFSSVDRRIQVLHEFLEAGELITHVHWNDNYIADVRGRNDRHRPLDHGQIPIEVHRKVSQLKATKHLERQLTVASLMSELSFIQKL